MMKSKKEYSVDDIPASLTVEDILEMKKEVEKVFIHDLIYQYTTDLVNATRKHQYLTLGVSPRGTLALINICLLYTSQLEIQYVLLRWVIWHLTEFQHSHQNILPECVRWIQ